MNLTSPRSRASLQAFSLVDLIVVVGILAILAGMLLPSLAKAKRKAQRIQCVNNLKQIGLGFRIFAVDNQDLFPMALATNQGGTKEFVPTSPASVHFQVLSNELTIPKVLVCPADTRMAAPDFRSLRNASLSYFVGLDAEETRPQILLAGDRNVTNGLAPVNGVLLLPPDRATGWTRELHDGQGNVTLADGSVQQFTSARLGEHLRQAHAADDRTNRIQLPE